MQSSTLFKVVLGCVCVFAGLTFLNFDAKFNFNQEVFNGENVTKEIQLEDFHSIALSLPAHVKIKEGNSNTVKISAPEKLIDLINTEIKSGQWNIKLTKKMSWKSYSNIDIAVEMNDIRALSVTGSGEIETEEHFKNLEKVKGSVTGSGDLTIRANLEKLDGGVSGSGNFQLYGTGDYLDLSVTGSGEVEAYEFEAREVDISISGSGDAYINATEKIDASVTGSGDIRYKGGAKVNSRVTGSGDIQAGK